MNEKERKEWIARKKKKLEEQADRLREIEDKHTGEIVEYYNLLDDWAKGMKLYEEAVKKHEQLKQSENSA